WEHVGHKESVCTVSWPICDESALVKDTVEVVIQINGKVKEKIQVANGLDRDEFTKIAMDTQKIKDLLLGKEIVKVIAVPNKLLNIVVK
ncbi:MAG: leucine--tRNA ligase, partial [Anaerovorax sp.]